MEITCPRCVGLGILNDRICFLCKGAGKISNRRRIDKSTVSKLFPLIIVAIVGILSGILIDNFRAINYLDNFKAFIRPLSGTTIPATVVAGLFFGRIYNRKLNLPDYMIYDKLVTGWGFLFFLFIFRFAQDIPSFAGYLGVMALWGLYMLFIYLGTKIP